MYSRWSALVLALAVVLEGLRAGLLSLGLGVLPQLRTLAAPDVREGHDLVLVAVLQVLDLLGLPVVEGPSVRAPFRCPW
jgi:hypothetical protein